MLSYLLVVIYWWVNPSYQDVLNNQSSFQFIGYRLELILLYKEGYIIWKKLCQYQVNYYDLLAYYRVLAYYKVHRHLLMYIDMWNKQWGFISAGNLERKKK